MRKGRPRWAELGAEQTGVGEAGFQSAGMGASGSGECPRVLTLQERLRGRDGL